MKFYKQVMIYLFIVLAMFAAINILIYMAVQAIAPATPPAKAEQTINQTQTKIEDPTFGELTPEEFEQINRQRFATLGD